MSRTPFCGDNYAFSAACHRLAQQQVYPALFGVPRSSLVFDDVTIVGNGSAEAQYFDGALGIDQRVYVTYEPLREGIPFTVQERFQKPTYANRRNITITEWNPHSNTPSEMYKCHAHFFVCGFFDIEKQNVIELVACPVAALMAAIGHKAVVWDRRENPRTRQPFIRIEIDELIRAKLVDVHIRDNRVLLAAHKPTAAPRKGRRIHTAAEFEELWPAVLARVKRKIGVTAVAYLHDAKPADFTETDAVIEYSKEFHFEKAREAASRVPFEQVINECFDAPRALVFRLSHQ